MAHGEVANKDVQSAFVFGIDEDQAAVAVQAVEPPVGVISQLFQEPSQPFVIAPLHNNINVAERAA
jgi:hypothetical protein